ncbi:MAG: hypothetical protein LBQ59_00550 [Candidatus Peribacteria bacterium]|nr:hypothetical protein [Candidatus Peribacteria bacterium]
MEVPDLSKIIGLIFQSLFTISKNFSLFQTFSRYKAIIFVFSSFSSSKRKSTSSSQALFPKVITFEKPRL